MFVKEVRDHAYANYEGGGWDYVVECYSDAEIAALTKTAKTAEEAIEMVGREVGIRDEYRKDIQGYGEW
jgi:hypothetical protein